MSDLPTDRNDLIVRCAQVAGCNTVLNGFGGSAKVHDKEGIASNGIQMRFLDKNAFDDVAPGLSYLHYLFVHGPKFFVQLADRMRNCYYEA